MKKLLQFFGIVYYHFFKNPHCMCMGHSNFLSKIEFTCLYMELTNNFCGKKGGVIFFFFLGLKETRKIFTINIFASDHPTNVCERSDLTSQSGSWGILALNNENGITWCACIVYSLQSSLLKKYLRCLNCMHFAHRP